MLELVQGCIVPDIELLSEQYQIRENTLLANVNASKIEEVLTHFITMQEEKIFLILEIPASMDEEERLRKTENEPFHVNIYYIDGLSMEQTLVILSRYGELLINDGLSKFGFGTHDNSAEIMLNKYNIVTIWTNQIEKYANFFDEHDISQIDECITAWETFSTKKPGRCDLIEIDGKSVYDLVQELDGWGIYLAEQRIEG